MIIKENWRQDNFLSNQEISDVLKESLLGAGLEKKKVIAIIPDSTRSGPTSLIFRTILETLYPVVEKIDFMIALGTHPPMNQQCLENFLQISLSEFRQNYKNSNIFQHRWNDESALVRIGVISAKDISEISGGLLNEDIPVTVNRDILDYDRIILAGPVFPHEVVGFSGGYKYIFPGISGPHFLHKFHWLGALITNPKINGTKNTPVREAIEKAVSFIKIPMLQICYVVKDKKVYGIFVGDKEAWSQAADISAKLNIRYVDRSFKLVLSMAPLMYDDIWTAGKCMYKLEPVVEDGGTLIIFAPHIKEVSYTHGSYIKQIGYHTRDYFLKQWDRFKDFPGGILAHSTHVKGIGTFIDGKEYPRINVVLATGISEQVCRQINLGYMDPASIDASNYENKNGVLVVREAGEVLFRLKSGEVPDIDKLYQGKK